MADETKLTIVKSNVANALSSAAADHVIAVADDIYDESLGEYQSVINQNIKSYSKGYGIEIDGDNTILAEVEYREGDGECNDAARTILGGDWKIPTKEDWNELISNTTAAWNNGIQLTSRINGQTIFLPAGGTYVGNIVDGDALTGTYWTSSASPNASPTNLSAYDVLFDMGANISVHSFNKYHGELIRPITKTPGNNVIDLGLPSGTLWSTNNLTSTGLTSSITSYGDYFAWGETAPKSEYSNDTYTLKDSYNTTDGIFTLRTGGEAGYFTRHNDELQTKLKAGDNITISNGVISAVGGDLSNYYNKTEVDNKISTVPKFSISVVSTLPTTNISSTTVYLVANTTTQTQNLYTEYIYVNSKWEKLGEQTIDLSGYATESWVEGKGYLTQHQSLTDYAKKSELPTIPTNVSAFTNDAGYLTEHQSLNGYATQSWAQSNFLSNSGGTITVPSAGTSALTINNTKSPRSYIEFTFNQGETGSLEADANDAHPHWWYGDTMYQLAFVSDVNGYYKKPSSGIPKSDLSSAVQSSLDKADSALPLSGGTMTGTITLKQNQYLESGGGINCNDADIIGCNSIYTGDLADNTSEGIRFYRDSTHWDSLTASGGVLYFKPNDLQAGVAFTDASVKKVEFQGHTHSNYLTGITKDMVTTALGYTPPTTDTNTWRGIQNNLTSTSTTDSLSAAQGKALNDKFGSYVAKAGDTMNTGAALIFQPTSDDRKTKIIGGEINFLARTSEGWATGNFWRTNDGGTNLWQTGVYGLASTIKYAYNGTAYNTPTVKYKDGQVGIAGTLNIGIAKGTAESISGGCKMSYNSTDESLDFIF